jgi:hemoglobin
MSDPSGPSVYDQVGGEAFFVSLVAEFYRGVASDSILRAMYPEDDLAPAAERLQLFLEQYWGGPGTYGERRGHPRLRMRHAPFAVDETARDHWLAIMRGALDKQNLTEELDRQLWNYFVMAAMSMVNVDNPALRPNPLL